MTQKDLRIEVGRSVEFYRNGARIGKVLRIRGNALTVVLAPYRVRGRFPGKRVRIRACDVTGIVHRKRVVQVEREGRPCKRR